MADRYQTIILLIIAVVPLWLILAAILVGPTQLDMIERRFGFAPDKGDGTLESALLVLIAAIVTGTTSVFFVRQR